MKILTTLFFLISLAGSAWAEAAREKVLEWRDRDFNLAQHLEWRDRDSHIGPAPEMSAGVLGMTLAAGVLYLLKRRNRT
jgi:hypothetical protein